MATADTASMPHDRHTSRRPFSKWMKRLASLKGPSSDSASSRAKRGQQTSYPKNKQVNTFKNSPYPASSKPAVSIPNSGNGRHSFCTPPSGRSISYASSSPSKVSLPVSHEENHPPTIGNKSTAPTLATNAETINSDTAHSKAGTTATIGGAVSSTGMGSGDGSTFSSPAPSVRSLTTTLTTMQSTAPSNLLATPNNQGLQTPLAVPQSNHSPQNSSTSQFSHPFPAPTPASAIPSHLTTHTGGGHPATYSTATANNQLTDDASIMTLASSSKRRRRNSLDTNASVRALAPNSLYGGSRESLPLSVLSSSINDQTSTHSHHQPRQVSVGLANTERASVYSSSGIAPALSSERNSYYAQKQANNPGDGGSVISGRVGHGRTDSITRSISGVAATESPLTSPRDGSNHEKVGKRNSERTEMNEEDDTSLANDKISLGRKIQE